MLTQNLLPKCQPDFLFLRGVVSHNPFQFKGRDQQPAPPCTGLNQHGPCRLPWNRFCRQSIRFRFDLPSRKHSSSQRRQVATHPTRQAAHRQSSFNQARNRSYRDRALSTHTQFTPQLFQPGPNIGGGANHQFSTTGQPQGKGLPSASVLGGQPCFQPSQIRLHHHQIHTAIT